MANAKKGFVCGHPINHSRSPLIHNYWLKAYGIEGSYEKIDIAPDDFIKFCGSLAEQGFVGGNVTIPHKELAFRSVEHLDDAAMAIGAVNTLWLENDKLHGGNTDAYGFAANLDDQIPQWINAESAVVFGAGGASRAIVYALIEAGIKKINIINRTIERAQTLASAFGPNVTAHGWDAAQELSETSELLINTTSLGMTGDALFPLNFKTIRRETCAADIVYFPLMTPFLTGAAENGLNYSDGLGMLLHQAVPGFERWFGHRPEVTPALRQHILDDIGANT